MMHDRYLKLFIISFIVGTIGNTVVATRTFTGLKPSISPSNVALNSNPGTVLETAHPEDSKTPPTC